MTYQAFPEPERSSMARKPKTQPSPEAVTATPAEELAGMNETPTPARRGRKQKADTSSPALPSVMLNDDTATTDAEADADEAVPLDAPRRRGSNRKSASPETATTAPPRREQTKRGRGRTFRQLDAETTPDPVEQNAQETGPVSRPEAAASADPVQSDAGPGRLSDDLQQPLPGLDVPSSTKPAAHWDRATDTVQFDWPAIERTAAEDGPNQGMAKLLVAARAEGANSRWPL